MNGQLYIGGKLADCDAESIALFTYRRENLDNPTVVRNSYTQQIRLKGTQANDAIFGQIWAGTRIAGSTGFDASARTPFVLYTNHGEVVESGYCKLDAIEKAGTDVTYLVTLYGGLGEILYKLSAADDGTPLTLADLYYGVNPEDPAGELTFTLNRTTIATAWAVLADQQSDDRFGVINFAHTADPLPDGFDASKLFCLGDDIAQSPPRDSGTIGTDEAVLLEMKDSANTLTAYQVGDFRCYLQRPVVSVRAILTAISNFVTDAGWTMNLDADFFKNGNPYYAKAWMTLRSFATMDKGQGDTVTKADLLGSAMSPLSFLVSYCRHFGLVITADHAAKTLDIRTRKNYYASTLPQLDLSGHVDLSQQADTKPLTFDARWYLLGEDPVAAFAEAYSKTHRTAYGTRRIDTGYAFDDVERKLLEGVPTKAVAMVQTLARGNDTFYLTGQPAEYRIPSAFWAIGTYNQPIATWQLARPHSPGETWNGNVVPGVLKNPTLCTATAAMVGEDGKVVDDFVLLFFDGFHNAEDPYEMPAAYYVSDDNPTWFDAYAGGVKCWLACGTTVTGVDGYPRFSRWITTPDGDDPDQTKIVRAWEIGQPQALGVANHYYASGATIWETFWADYMGDRYDADAKIVTVKANLSGLPRPAELLRRFVWWDGALWSVNAVQDYDPLGEALTTLELVRVTDPAKYRTLNL